MQKIFNCVVYHSFLHFFHTKNKDKVAINTLSLRIRFASTKIMEMFRTLLFTLLIIAISFALLSITIIIKKKGRFPNIHIGGNKNMRKRGIKCAQSQDRDARKENPMAVKETNKK